jgi:outer membrane protein TolC
MKVLSSFRWLLLFLAPASVWGGENKKLTLHECINEALGRSPQLVSEQYTLAGDQEAIKKARAGLWPSLKTVGSLENLTGAPNGPFSVLGVNDLDTLGVVSTSPSKIGRFTTVYVNQGTVGLGSMQLNYPLYENGSILGLNNAPVVASAKSTFVRQQWTIRLSEQTVIETLAAAYFNAAAYQRKLESDQRKVELSKKKLAIMQQELALDLTLPQNVELAKAELAASEQLLQTSKLRAADGAMQLAQLIGRPLHQQLNLDLSEPRIPSLPPVEQFLNRVAQNHPAIGMQAANIDIAKQNLRLAESALWPTVNFTANYGVGTAFATQNPSLFTVGLHVSIPVFDWGHNLDSEREERDRLKAAQAELGQVDLEVRESILNQLSDIHSTESTIAGLESNYVQAKNNYDLTNEQKEQGIAKELGLVNAESELLKVKDGLLLAKLVQQLQYVQLQKLSGGVWAWNK